ncbi:MAG: hydrogenase maturation protease [Opitutae bacterium]|nr:hydrogenase maturation protease [Opitutae bacterium]
MDIGHWILDIEIPSLPILIYGYGNPGRQDDGLGVALVEELETWAKAEGLSGLVFDSNYQLNAEDALAVAESRAVVFIDAAKEGAAPFEFRRLEPRAEIAFSTHAMSPESVLAVAAELYGARPPAWLLAIRGCAWEPNEAPTPAALAHLVAAGNFLREWLRERR